MRLIQFTLRQKSYGIDNVTHYLQFRLFAHEEDADIDVPMAEPQGHTLGSTATQPKDDSASTEPQPETAQQESTAGGDNETQEQLQAKSFKCDE